MSKIGKFSQFAILVPYSSSFARMNLTGASSLIAFRHFLIFSCGPGTSWDTTIEYCVENPLSSGWNGTYEMDYQEGCALRRCCEVSTRFVFLSLSLHVTTSLFS